MPQASFSDLVNGEKPTFVDFSAEWCGPCKMMTPELKRFAGMHKDEIRVLKIDVDKNPETASHFNIQGVPTLILFKQGKILWRQSGAMNAQQLSAVIKNTIPA